MSDITSQNTPVNSQTDIQTFNPFTKFGENVILVLGTQFGDEGKGKLVDILASYADVCARFNGGSNAGHTIVLKSVKYALHLLPCGCLYEKTINVIGNGCVVHLKTLVEEVECLSRVNKNIYKQVYISSRAHLLFDIHQSVDAAQELAKEKEGKMLGTTKRGIGPCYSTKVSRNGIRVGDLENWPSFEQKYTHLHNEMKRLYNINTDLHDELLRHKAYYEILKDQIVDTVPMLNKSLKTGQNILIEGANATMLDIDFGTYPYVTSSSTTAGGASIGLCIPPSTLRCCIGVVKSYLTRVGEGPFITEIYGGLADHFLYFGHEFGTTTGRPRRIGWLDIPMLRYAHAINGFTAFNLTKLDVLTGLKQIKICVDYQNKHTKEVLPPSYYPTCLSEFDDLEAKYIILEGWTSNLSNCKQFSDFPNNTKTYIRTITQLTEIPILWVGVGPDRDHTVYIES